ncbi:aromatic ring-hydroxylating dioxygenase subunit alpha [Micromonospora sp. CA-111912]|uniref:aromatic ring-hydroxylating dioxygenase subunit alpha n=1 Tax=Micromonospora sp. CA-111912 TaxID=3239955 RepID=UPI003D9336E7
MTATSPTSHQPRRAAPSQPGTDMRLAAGWYLAMASAELRRGPRKLDLFGRELVAWRDGTGRASIMPRHCPHFGASLAVGKVVDGSLRCAFHHWRFDATGACASVPGMPRLSQSMRQPRAYPLVERYGYVWIWYGGGVPAYPLPEVPALTGHRNEYLSYRFSHTTAATPRRVLENAFDHYHFMALHGVACDRAPELVMLPEPAAAAENGPPIPEDAWTGARLEFHGLQVPAAIRALGLRSEKFELLVDGWPAGQRLTFLLDGEVVVKELLGVTPVGPGRTHLRGWSLVRRTGNPARDRLVYLAYRAHHWWGTREDLAIYRNADDTAAPTPTRYDHALLRFRKQYATWVDRAEEGAL